MYTIAVFGLQGGVGRTIISVGLAEQYSLMGLRVLLLDASSQADATSHLGFPKRTLMPEHYFFAQLEAGKSTLPMVPTHSGIRLGPMVYGGSKGINTRLRDEARRYMLRDALHDLPHIDLTIVDCPRDDHREGHTYQVLNAADGIIFVVRPERPLDALQDMQGLIWCNFPQIRILGGIPALHTILGPIRPNVIPTFTETCELLQIKPLPGIRRNSLISLAADNGLTPHVAYLESAYMVSLRRKALSMFQDLALEIAKSANMTISYSVRLP